MHINERIALARAGYKKKEIEALIEEELKELESSEDTTEEETIEESNEEETIEESEDTTDYKELSESLAIKLKEAEEKIKKIQEKNVNTDNSGGADFNKALADAVNALI